MDQRIEALAEAIWRYYYPQGGSIYSTYASLPKHDKIIHRKEAAQVAAFLSGTATIQEV